MSNQEVEPTTPLEPTNPNETPQTNTDTQVPAHGDHDDLAKLCRSVEHSALSGSPYISGTFQLAAHKTGLFYRSQQGVTGYLNFANASLSDIRALSDACQPASFGLDGVDSTDREAGELDALCFATKFSPEQHGIMDMIVRDMLNEDKDSDKLGFKPSIKLDMHRLNVYGPGSSFKRYAETPRPSDVFGSLVVVLPALHEGGELIVRHTDQEWSIDASDSVVDGDSDATNDIPPGDGSSGSNTESDVNNTTRVSFAAFYSNAELEVTPIISGYRVTITYLLSFVHPPPSSSSSPSPPLPNVAHRTPTPNPTPQIHIRTSALTTLTSNLTSLLSHPDFLPSGGLIGFKLTHQYPIDLTEYTKSNHLQKKLTPRLTGRDARIFDALSSLALPVHLRMLYKFLSRGKRTTKYMTRGIVTLHGSYVNGDGYASDGDSDMYTLEEGLLSVQSSARMVYDVDLDGLSDELFNKKVWLRVATNLNKGPKRRPKPIFWINPIDDADIATVVGTPFVEPPAKEGREGYVKYLYGEVVIICQIGKVGDRRKVVPFMGREVSDPDSNDGEREANILLNPAYRFTDEFKDDSDDDSDDDLDDDSDDDSEEDSYDDSNDNPEDNSDDNSNDNSEDDSDDNSEDNLDDDSDNSD